MGAPGLCSVVNWQQGPRIMVKFHSVQSKRRGKRIAPPMLSSGLDSVAHYEGAEAIGRFL